MSMRLDRKSARVLSTISSISNGEYKVIEISGLIQKLPKKYAMSVDELSNIFSYLKDVGYIDIKHFDDEEICYAILPKSRIYEENLLEERKLNMKFAFIIFISGIVSGICGFCGAIVSHIIVG